MEDDNDSYLVAEGFASALLGYGTHFSHRVAIYDYDKCVEALVADNEWTHEDAVEYMEVNVCGAWLGDGTPVFLRLKKVD